MAGKPVIFDGANSTDDKGIASYAWEFGDGASATGVKVTHTYTTGGNYTVKLTVTDGDGATDTFSRGIVITGIISITCAPASITGNYDCMITGADTVVDFSAVRVEVLKNSSSVGMWAVPVTYNASGVASIYSVAPPLGNCKIIDDGDGKFGVNDVIKLVRVSASYTLHGLKVKLYGGLGYGEFTIP